MASKTSLDPQNALVFNSSSSNPTGSSKQQDYSLYFQRAQESQSTPWQRNSIATPYVGEVSNQSNQISSHVQNRLNPPSNSDSALMHSQVRHANIEEMTIRQLQLGLKSLRDDALNDAIYFFQNALNLQLKCGQASDETNAFVYTFLGKTYEKAGCIDMAIACWLEGIKFQTATPTTLANLYGHLGNAHVLKNEPHQARDTYEKAISQSTTNDGLKLQWCLRLGWLYQTLGIGSYEDAIQLFCPEIQFKNAHHEIKMRFLINVGTTMHSMDLLYEARIAFQLALMQGEKASDETRVFSAVLLAENCIEEALNILCRACNLSVSDKTKMDLKELVFDLLHFKERIYPNTQRLNSP